MEDWLHCAACGTLYPYDAERKVAECPYCKARVPYVVLPRLAERPVKGRA
jgi:DNA-directed RNA polymerase subunit RPC12/RpoP